MNRVLSAGGLLAVLLVVILAAPTPVCAQRQLPPFADVLKGYRQVAPKEGSRGLYNIWRRDSDAQLYAELPSDYTRSRYFIALTIASGERFAGLQFGDLYVYWRRYGNRLALMEPNISTRSSGDPESKSSVKRLFTDRVILDVPIVTMGPTGGPVIDLDSLLLGRASTFFGSAARVSNPALSTIKQTKVFPRNVEIAIEAPMSGGRLKTLHYSISVIKGSSGYRPRKADQRVGYFTTSHTDLGTFDDDKKRVRFINRWHLEKAEPSLKRSPVKRPIEFYIEHTTPIRYRRWVREGILYWSRAFEKIGLLNAIVVHQQDARTGRYMDLDPEDVNYNFVRWLNNDIGTAIGPSRVNPMTGEILDADIIMTDGWIRSFYEDFHKLLPKIALEGFGPESLAWLHQHPNWDPRIRLAHPEHRADLLAARRSEGLPTFGGHPLGHVSPLIGDDEFDGLVGRTSQLNGMCLAATGRGFDLSVLRASLALLTGEETLSDGEEPKEGEEKPKESEKDEEKKKEEKGEKEEGEKKDEAKKEEKKDEGKKDEKKDEKKEEKPKKPDEDLLDGIPESFIGPLIADLIAHEVGHTLGLRHNFKASSIYSLDEINSKALDDKPIAGSVMDYLPININMDKDAVQGEYAMPAIGPYDMWAIEYGYALKDSDLKKILSRVADPALQYATDEDTYGPDPFARRYDFSAKPLEYAASQMRLVKYHRERLLEKYVKDGDSWAKARQGYEMTFSMQIRSVSMMANWVGGAFVHRDKKGDKNARPPVIVVPAERQRKALSFVIENSFFDEAFGLTPKLLQYMSVDQWLDGGFFSLASATWPVHDRIMGIQSSALTMLMNPSTLRNVYDNEFRTPNGDDMVTLAELLTTVKAAIWKELDEHPLKKHTARNPWLSSLRRNLQREHLERLIDLSMPGAGSGAAYKPISNLALVQLRDLSEKIQHGLDHRAEIDEYSYAHLVEADLRIKKALDAQFIYNADDVGGGGFGSFFFFKNPANGAKSSEN